MSRYFKKKNRFAIHDGIKSDCLRGESGDRRPLFSIVVPTYRRPELLAQTLQSAVGQLGLVDYEIVVVDNDPEPGESATQNVVDALQCPQLRYFRNRENLGMFGNWNRGLLLATGKWATLLHDDDLLTPDFLSEMQRVCTDNPGRALVYCETRILDRRQGPSLGGRSNQLRAVLVRSLSGRTRRRNLGQYFLGAPHLGTVGVVFDRMAAIELGGFDQEDYPSADYFFFTRYVAEFGAIHLIKHLAAYRVEQNESLRDSVMTAWVRQGLDFREALVAEYYGGSAWRRCLARMIAVSQAYDIQRDWGGTYDADLLLTELGCSFGVFNGAVRRAYKFGYRIRQISSYLV